MKRSGYDFDDDATLGYMASLPLPKRHRLRTGGGSASARRAGGAALAAAAAAGAAAATSGSGRMNMRTGGYLGLEKKFVDYEYDAAVSSALAGSEADPAGGALSAISQGDGESSRDGRRCTLLSVHVQGFLELPRLAGTALSDGARVKLVLLHDKQTNGAQVNAEDVFVDPTNTELDSCTFRNLQYQKRFAVLGMKVVDLNLTAGAGNGTTNDTSNTMRSFELHHEFKKPVIVEHSGTTANVSAITDNSVHLLAVSTNFSTSPIVQLRYYSRVRFIG